MKTMTVSEYRAAAAKQPRRRRGPTPEGEVKKLIDDWLELEQRQGHLDYARMNTGAAKIGTQLVRFGIPGMADFMVRVPRNLQHGLPWGVLWLEVKAPGGKQNKNQLAFMRRATLGWGDLYLVVESLTGAMDAVEAARRR